ncbi:D-aminoacylase [Vanrija pseudolonga]|uniref:D-aminoacylase n=1 Tax=Vanrija pseudolonga TaxID=143232 RepID=A0AAF1BHX1_9TREE|nr:D-aminoacylase [Vanrija pseudolonga]
MTIDPPTSTLFRAASVVSGEEDAVPYTADVLVTNGVIAKIAPSGGISAPPGARVVDAAGYYLSPGFIDMHAHSDLYLLTHADHEAKITQGCTTEVVGQDGIAYAPVHTDEQMTAIREQITAWNGNPSDDECATTLKDVGMFQWRSIKEYLDALDRNRTATNVAMLVPQGNLRLLTVGPRDDVASAQHIQDQVALLHQGMRDGAVGMSSGLTYTPGMYASNSELAVLCSALAQYPGSFYAPHHRSYGANAIESYGEMIDLGETTGCAVHLTHATLNFPENKNRAPELVDMIDTARDKGVDITLDTYPYLPGCTTLSSKLPSWALSGGPEETLERLRDPAICEEIRVAVEDVGCDGGHGIPTDWQCVEIGSTAHPDLEGFAGRRVDEVARSLGREPFAVFIDILVKDKLATGCILHTGNEENVQYIMKHEVHTGGSDAILHGQTLHPRSYGTFPRYLGHYARDLGLMSIPHMVAHLTTRPAKRLGVYPTRGVVREGSAADLVLFDPTTVKDMSSHTEPRATAKGIRFVLVNGQVAIDEGKMTGARAGVTIRRRKDGKVTDRGE